MAANGVATTVSVPESDEELPPSGLGQAQDVFSSLDPPKLSEDNKDMEDMEITTTTAPVDESTQPIPEGPFIFQKLRNKYSHYSSIV